MCEHLAHLGIDPEYVEPPSSPTVTAPSVINTRTMEWEDELDLPPGVLTPFNQGFTEETAKAEVLHRDRLCVDVGLPTYTALEYDTNVWWVR